MNEILKLEKKKLQSEIDNAINCAVYLEKLPNVPLAVKCINDICRDISTFYYYGLLDKSQFDTIINDIKFILFEVESKIKIEIPVIERENFIINLPKVYYDDSE